MTLVSLIRPYYKSCWEANGLGSIAAYLKKYGRDVEVKFFDGFFESEDHMVEGAKDSEIVGISCTSPQFKSGLKIAGRLKKENPNIRVVMGGFHPSALPDRVYAYPQVDDVVVGEGEEAFLDIVEGKSKGIVRAKQILNLDKLPWPDRSLIRVDRTIALTEKNDGERITSVEGNRGCPFNCTFCGEHIKTNHVVRHRNPELLLDEIEYVVNEYRIDFLKFSDAEINHDIKFVKSFCKAFLKRKIDVEFGANIHASVCDAEMFRLMKKSNFREVWIGCESGSPRILQSIKKGITVESIKKAFRLSKVAGLTRRAYFIVGLPRESRDDWEMTLKLAEEIDADIYGATLLAPYPGTDIYDEYKDELDLENLDWSSVDEYQNDVWKTEYFSNSHLQKMQIDFIEKFKNRLTFRHKFDKGEVG